MRRIPSGLRKISKDELLTQLTNRFDERFTQDAEVIESRVGNPWSKPEDEKITKRSIRW